MRKPKKLQPGDTIAFASPARYPEAGEIENACTLLEKAGFKVLVHPSNTARHHQLAGDDRFRAHALGEMFADPKINAILCTRGGIGSYRLLDYLDYNLIKRSPKIFCGFSDITTLHMALAKKCSLVTFHGPLALSFHHQPVLDHFLNTLQNKFDDVPQTIPCEVLHPGKAEAKLVGGNLTLLQNLIGTEYDWSAEGSILMLEDTEEPWSGLDRTLYHLKRAGKFRHIKGVILGEMSGMSDEKGRAVAWGEDYRKEILKLIPPGLPVVANLPVGHGQMLLTLPLGTRISLETGENAAVLRLTESPFA